MSSFRRFVVLCSVLCSVLALAAVALVTADDAGATHSPVRSGLGYRVAGGDFVGFYVTGDGRKVYCLDPDKAAPVRITLGAVERYLGTSRVVTAELSYALTHWGDASSRAAAAVESQVLNTLVGNGSDVRRRSHEIPAQLRARVATHLRMTRAYFGPYTVAVALPRSLGVGQSAVGSATVRTATGRAVPHIGLVVSHGNNATAADWARTDSHGVAHFRYAVTDVGPVHIGVTAVALPATGILTSNPTSGQQHLVAWRHRVTAHASASFVRRPNGLSATYACSTTCNGHPRLTVRACAAPSRVASRLTYRIGATTRVVAYPSSAARRCVSVPIIAADGDRVTAEWQYRAGRGWSRPVAAAGSIRVDCPPVPDVAVTMTYNCSQAVVSFALAHPGTTQPLVNTTRHRMVLVVTGARHRRIYAGRGRSAGFSATASCQAPVSYHVRAGIRRVNGRYNYGPIASVTTPGSGR